MAVCPAVRAQCPAVHRVRAPPCGYSQKQAPLLRPQPQPGLQPGTVGTFAGGAEGAVAARAPDCSSGDEPCNGGFAADPSLRSQGGGSRAAALQHRGPSAAPPHPTGLPSGFFIQGSILPPHPPSKRLSPLLPFISALFIPVPCAALAGAGVPGEGVPAPRVGWAVLQRGLEADVPDKDAALPLSFFFFFF